jgi:biopolymer transport protein ExbD
MLFWHEEPKRKARIELIPMIDVMMFLLVFFVLLSLNVIPAKGLKTELPTSSQRENLKPVRHFVVSIAKNGDVTMENQTFSLTALASRLSSVAKTSSNIDVVINGDKGVDMQKLIDVMDTVKSSGINGISIATKGR